MRKHSPALLVTMAALVALLSLALPGASWAAESDPWVQVGSAVNLATADQPGFRGGVAVSADGDVVAVGSPSDDTAATDAGAVRVYQYSGGWSQRGADVRGVAASDVAGTSVALSNDGLVLAVGAPGNSFDMGETGPDGWVRVYDWNGSAWVQRGEVLAGVNDHDRFGFSVSLSNDGSVLAVGSPRRDASGLNAGRTTIYTWTSGAWSARGFIDGAAASDQSGWSVSLNGTGTRVAIGARFAGGSLTGQVRVFNEDVGLWTQVGGSLDGVAWAGFGTSVSLSDDGDVVAVGAPDDASSRGNTFVYALAAGAWSQRGSTIAGERGSDLSGTSVSLSSDGRVVAIGAEGNDDAGTEAGHARVYRWNSGAWSQRGADINGSTGGAMAGKAVALDSAGRSIAVRGSDAVRIYSHPGSPEPPPAPHGVTGTAANASVAVSWSPPASDGGETITRYTVTAGTGESCFVTSVAPATPATTCTVSGLTNGASYTFTVTATNSAGTGSPSTASAPVVPRTLPGQPTGVSGAPGDGSVVVSWTPPASDGGATVTGYTVTAGTGESCSVTSVAPATPATTCTVSGLTNGASYTFTVTATNSAGTGATSAPSAPVIPVPTAQPTELAPAPAPSTQSPASTAPPLPPAPEVDPCAGQSGVALAACSAAGTRAAAATAAKVALAGKLKACARAVPARRSTCQAVARADHALATARIGAAASRTVALARCAAGPAGSRATCRAKANRSYRARVAAATAKARVAKARARR